MQRANLSSNLSSVRPTPKNRPQCGIMSRHVRSGTLYFRAYTYWQWGHIELKVKAPRVITLEVARSPLRLFRIGHYQVSDGRSSLRTARIKAGPNAFWSPYLIFDSLIQILFVVWLKMQLIKTTCGLKTEIAIMVSDGRPNFGRVSQRTMLNGKNTSFQWKMCIYSNSPPQKRYQWLQVHILGGRPSPLALFRNGHFQVSDRRFSQWQHE